MHPKVTIAIPVYRRLDLLPNALACVRAQDYPSIDLLVSDNGGNAGERENLIRALITEHYDKPYRYRRNPATVPIYDHFNQLVAVAEGEYFTLLCDDDAISPDFVSELMGLFQKYPQIGVALPRHVMVFPGGETFQSGYDEPRPEILGDEEFFQVWCQEHYNVHAVVLTNLARTEEVRRVGGFLPWPRAAKTEDALLIKLSLGRAVGLAQSATFYWSLDPNSTGFSAPPQEIATCVRNYLTLIDTDPMIQEFARANPDKWKRLRVSLRRESFKGYMALMQSTYLHRLTWAGWVRAALELPFLPYYYYKMSRTFLRKTVLTLAGKDILRKRTNFPELTSSSPSTP